MTLSRRSLFAGSVSLPTAKAAVGIPTSARQAEHPAIGDTRDVFDAWFGSGIEAGPYIQYQPLAAGRAQYAVEFGDNNKAVSLLGEFHSLDGGIKFSQDDVGHSPFVPADATMGSHFKFGHHKDSDGRFELRRWESQSLAEELGGHGNLAVMDRIEGGMDPMGTVWFRFTESLIGTDRPEVNQIVPAATYPGPHSSLQEWVEYNSGNSLMSEAGLVLSNPPLPGQWIINYLESSTSSDITTHNITLSTPVSTQEAAQFIAERLPVAKIVSSAWFHPTPHYGEGFRIHQFLDGATNRTYLTAQKIEGDEESGTVDRIYMAPAQP